MPNLHNRSASSHPPQPPAAPIASRRWILALTVLSVAYPFAAVSPDAVGGAEQVLAQLDRALVGSGHRSIVVACEGSRVTGTLVTVPCTPGLLDESAIGAARQRHRDAIAATLRRFPIDLVHM